MLYVGAARALTDDGLSSAAESLKCTPADLWAVVTVETGGVGFLPDRRMPMLFERHVFHRKTRGRYHELNPEVSNPRSGGYGSADHEYGKLAHAIALDARAALQSASWGLPQIMGFNHEMAGYDSPALMIDAFKDSEDAQLAGMARFISFNPSMTRALRARSWANFARAYNGPEYWRNQYDERLAGAYATLVKRGLPDLHIRAMQLEGTYLGIYAGKVDGIDGPKTQAMLDDIRRRAGAGA